ncbi:Zn-ribbon domain-containing OB-fold protein [Pseudonocardia ailaonensis]|uniref:Zn-ribbon domain-containing OB-fold protein n=1 Tax=Pseudonocardia ailaonensis TaxID=367279 RepID=A0ABN2NGL4_9PSEU
MEKVAPPVPVPDDVTAPFWAATARGELHIQRCLGCRRFQQPPAPLCTHCAGADLRFEPVTGRARLHSWTRTCAGTRHPAFDERTPYLVALVELVEQEGLFLYTNLQDPVPAGTELEVGFEGRHGFALPRFRPVP